MPSPFEEPAKADLRSRCEIAIDHAGHELVEAPVRITVPQSSNLQGGLKGDLQSLDGEAIRYVYYLRVGAEESLPKWLSNLAMAARSVPDVKFYVVAANISPAFERSCRAAGAGLLTVNVDNEFEHAVDFDEVLPEPMDQEFQDRLATLRRSVEHKLDLHVEELRNRYSSVTVLTSGMRTETAESYTEGLERQIHAWEDWSVRLSRRLDDALGTRTPDLLDTIAAEVEQGPVLDDDVD